jgi:hypothetical protein
VNKKLLLVLAGSLIAGVILAFTPAGAFVAAHWLPLTIGVVIVVAFTWLCIEAVRAPLDDQSALSESEMELLGKFRSHPDVAWARGEVASEEQA